MKRERGWIVKLQMVMSVLLAPLWRGWIKLHFQLHFSLLHHIGSLSCESRTSREDRWAVSHHTSMILWVTRNTEMQIRRRGDVEVTQRKSVEKTQRRYGREGKERRRICRPDTEEIQRRCREDTEGTQRKCKEDAKETQRRCKENTEWIQRKCREDMKGTQRKHKDDAEETRSKCRVDIEGTLRRCIQIYIYKVCIFWVASRTETRGNKWVSFYLVLLGQLAEIMDQA